MLFVIIYLYHYITYHCEQFTPAHLYLWVPILNMNFLHRPTPVSICNSACVLYTLCVTHGLTLIFHDDEWWTMTSLYTHVKVYRCICNRVGLQVWYKVYHRTSNENLWVTSWRSFGLTSICPPSDLFHVYCCMRVMCMLKLMYTIGSHEKRWD